MVKIRLMRVGKRKQPSYRVVVADSRSPRDGRIIEAIGRYSPRNEPSVVEINTDRAVHWLQHGAQPSDSVRKLLQISGAWYTFTGERPPTGVPATGAAASKPTPAESIKATPAASVEEEAADETAGAAAPEAATEAEPDSAAAVEGADDEAGSADEESE
jgi:small subunit ribosomal protein S16